MNSSFAGNGEAIRFCFVLPFDRSILDRSSPTNFLAIIVPGLILNPNRQEGLTMTAEED
jgi:hypothetical protein